MNDKFNRTKIIATIGPSTQSKEVIKQMVLEGLDVCRINFSHGDYSRIKEVVQYVREINKELGTFVGLLGDLQGPKLRIGIIKGGSIHLQENHEIILTTKECEGDEYQVYINYPQFAKDVKPKEKVLLDDGKIQLEVIETDGKENVKCKVISGGTLSSKKGVNLPNTKISLPSLTIKDLRDLDFALENDFDWIGLSFVRSVTDIIELKEVIRNKGKNTRVVAKIEKPEALKEMDQIINASDGIMVARGDLGVELPMEQVPLLQKKIVEKCIKASKPVIIATQMMESMIENYSPTRAEVNDVANAVMDGADAVMLSAETSVGKYPVKVIEIMRKIITQVEDLDTIYYRHHAPEIKTPSYITDSICYTACVLSKEANVKAIITMTNSGYSAFKLASHRPKARIFVFTDNKALLTTLSMVWGVAGYYYDKYESTDQTINDLKEFLKNNKVVKTDDLVINIASMPMKEKGRTNMMKLSYI